MGNLTVPINTLINSAYNINLHIKGTFLRFPGVPFIIQIWLCLSLGSHMVTYTVLDVWKYKNGVWDFIELYYSNTCICYFVEWLFLRGYNWAWDYIYGIHCKNNLYLINYMTAWNLSLYKWSQQTGQIATIPGDCNRIA